MSKEHAVHNQEACDFLLQSGQFNDWVITTAFYAALHFVRHELFPLTVGEMVYDTPNAYFAALQKRGKRVSNHGAIIQLVNSCLPRCSIAYRWLHDACYKARYDDFQVPDNRAKEAMQYLEELRGCLKK